MPQQKLLRPLALILLCCMLPLLSGCQYYGKKLYTNTEGYILQSGQRYVARDFSFFVHRGGKVAQFGQVYFDKFDDKIVGQLTEIEPSKVEPYLDMQGSGLNRMRGSEKKDARQVHIFVDSYEDLGDGKIQIDGDKITKVDVYTINGIVTLFASAALVAVTYVAALAVFLVIYCSCPHVYSWDGDGFVFSSTLFTGAVNRQLEREDFKRVPDFFPEASSVKLQIRDEEYEKQYIDQLLMQVVLHDTDEQAYVNQSGDYILVKDLISASSVSDSSGRELSELVESQDDLFFDFDYLQDDTFSQLYVSFDPETTQSDKLLIRLKNAKWGSMAYKDMTKLFGHRYDDWREKNKDKTSEEINQWLSDQQLKLRVEQKVEGAWQLVEEIEMVGDEIFSEYYVEVDTKQPYEFRLSTGFKFWDLDYIALAKDYREATEVTTQVPSGDQQLLSLQEQDEDYFALLRQGDQLEVRFEDLPVELNRSRTLFLKSKGYYEANYTYDSRMKPVKLLPFRHPGSLSRYAAELHKDFQSAYTLTYSSYE